MYQFPTKEHAVVGDSSMMDVKTSTRRRRHLGTDCLIGQDVADELGVDELWILGYVGW